MIARWLGLPAAASAHAADVDRLIGNVHVLIGLLAVGWLVFLGVCLLRFHHRRQPVARHASAPAAVAWVLVSAIAAIELGELFFAALPLWASRVNGMPRPSEATVVRVVAEQFAWNVHYPGPDGVFGRTVAALVTPENPIGLDRRDPAARDDFATINDLEFPVNRPVIVQLTSKDVIHSFSLPQMRIKQDAIPGMVVPVWFVPTMTTPAGERWEINCSQLCGQLHYRMRGYYRSLSPADYDAFVRAQQAALIP